jgi:hypothetical protein
LRKSIIDDVWRLDKERESWLNEEIIRAELRDEEMKR